MSDAGAALTTRVLEGDVAAAAALLRGLDERRPEAMRALAELYPRGGRAFVVGLTGGPGVGKSSLLDRWIAALRSRGLRIAVVAVDPSSPRGGGAILGDRVRMQRHAADDGVFIRSLAARGALGGLSRATGDAVDVFDAMGFDWIFVETVGVGQSEIEIASLAEVVAVVLAPGLGDEIQAMKAGLHEIADLFVVNKADRGGADRVAADLIEAAALRGPESPPPFVVQTSALTDRGTSETIEALTDARWRLADQEGPRRQARARARLRAILIDRAAAEVERALGSAARLEELARAVAARELDPYAAAGTLSIAP